MDNNIELLIDAAKNGRLEEIRDLVRLGASLTIGNAFNLTLLHYAAGKNHVSVVDFLIKSGVPLNPIAKWYHEGYDDYIRGITPLHLAAMNGHDSVVESLVKAGANIDVFAEDLTPLNYAIMNAHLSVVKILLHGGSDYTILTRDDQTVRDMAIDFGEIDIASFIEEWIHENYIKDPGYD